MKAILRFLSPYWLWAVLSPPAVGFLAAAINSDSSEIYEQLHQPTGEFSARFMIIAMLAPPLMLIFKGWRGPLWLKKNRRYFGVAAFGYAALHTVFYLVDSQTLDCVFWRAAASLHLDGLAGLCNFHSAGSDIDRLFRASAWAALEIPATLDLRCGRSDLASLGVASRLGWCGPCHCPFRPAWPA